MDSVQIIGGIAGVLIVSSLLPQLILIIKNKSVKDVSLKTYCILFVAEIAWILYGVLINDLQIILTNIVSGFITLLILLFGIYYNWIVT